MNRKEKEMLQRKNDIIEAARLLFIEKGYDNVKMEDISKKAEFARRTLYSYFKSKIDLAVEIIISTFVDFDAQIANNVSQENSTYEKAFTFGKTYYLHFKRTPEYYKLLYHFDLAVNNEANKLSTTVINDLNNATTNIEGMFKRIILEGMNNGDFRSDLNPDLAVAFFLKSLYGIIHQYILHPQFPEESFYEELSYLLRAFTNTITNGG